ncbi:MAG: hypothetical protein AAGH45_01095 [Pseudomonadota bacterium]
MVDWNTDDEAKKVIFYRLRNRLKDKTGGVGGGSLDIDKEALEKAQAAFETVAEDYPDWVMGNIKTLIDHHTDLHGAAEGHDRERIYTKVRELTHDMRGQGGTFGYPLITNFADSLYGFVGPNAGTSDNHLEIIKSHIDAMNVVIRERIKGDGGEEGAVLATNLKQAIEKYSKVD